MPEYTFTRAASGVVFTTIHAGSPEEAIAKLRIAESRQYPDDGTLVWTADKDLGVDEGEIFDEFVDEKGNAFEGAVFDLYRQEIKEHKAETLAATVQHGELGATNKEGLSFKYWLFNAGIENGDLNTEALTIGSAYQAWQAGEDPTEWKAAGTKGEKL